MSLFLLGFQLQLFRALLLAAYALYPDGRSAQQAVNRLRAAGLADRRAAAWPFRR